MGKMNAVGYFGFWVLWIFIFFFWGLVLGSKFGFFFLFLFFVSGVCKVYILS